MSANILNGIYNCAEVVLNLLLLSFLGTIISWYNLKTVYDDRKPLRLKRTGLSFICDPGLAPPNLARAAVVIATLVLGLSVSGGFGIVGKTERIYEDVRVRNKVVGANGSYIDFRDHISKDGKLVSGTVLLLQHPFCLRGAVYSFILYSCVNDLDDLTTVKWPSDSWVLNSTCVMEESGFKTEIILQEFELLEELQTDLRNCAVDVALADLPKSDITRVPVSHETNAGCQFYIDEVWCSNFLRTYCVGSMKIAGGFGEVHVLGDSLGRYGYRFFNYRTEKQQKPEMLKSLAFLHDVVKISPSNSHRWMAQSRIETDALVKKFVGMRNVTDISVVFIAATFGTAVVITLLTGLLACMGWILYVAKPGRRNYNKFNSASDAMSCASFVMFGGEGCSLSGRNGGLLLKETDGSVRPERVLANGKKISKDSDSNA